MITSPELFNVEDSDGVSGDDSINGTPKQFSSLDECLDSYLLAEYIRGQTNQSKWRQIGVIDRDMRPVAFIRMNT